MNNLLTIIVVGVGATVVMDIWGVIRRPLLGVAPANYAMVGRWFGHFFRGRFFHDAIGAADAVPGERILGWLIHYLTGIAFAGLMIGIWGADWIQHPTIGPALAVGIGTIVAPFFLMQPGMGAGIAASRTPNPASARLQSLITHAVFGLGLYLAGWSVQQLSGV